MRTAIVGFDDEITAELDEALVFFVKILFHPNMSRNMSFTVQRLPELVLAGECWPEDYDNRQFVIDIRDAPGDDEPSSTLAHELVHCRQWARKELSVTSSLVARKSDSIDGIEFGTAFCELWHGEIWTPKPGEHPYFDSPWEVEAYGKEVGMMARWRDFREKKEQNEIVSLSGSKFACSLGQSTSDGSDDWISYYGGA